MAFKQYLVDLDLSKNQLLNAVVQNLATAPTSPNDGQIYWDTSDNTLYVWNADASTWIDLGSSGVTNLGYTAGELNGVVTSSTGSNSTIPLADGTNAGLISASEKTNLNNQSGVNTGDNAVNSLYDGLESNVSTNLSEGTATTTSVDVNSSDGTNATLAQASATRAGVLSSAKFNEIAANTLKVSDINHNVTTNLSEGTTTTTSVDVNSSDGTNATLAQASSTRAGVLSSAKFDEIEANTLKVSDINHNVDTNLGMTRNTTQVVVTSSDGTNATIPASTQSLAGIMTAADKAKLDGIEAGAGVNEDETLTSLGLAANILTYTDENGDDTDIDLSLYLDDSNLARLTSGSINGSTGLATFTRDDASTFTIDMSAFLDAITLNNTLTSTSTTEGLTAAQGKVLKDLIDALPTSDTQRSDEEIRDVAAAQWVNGTNTTVVVDDTNNTIKINATDTNTQLSDGDIAALGYVKTVGWDELSGSQDDISLSGFDNDLIITQNNSAGTSTTVNHSFGQYEVDVTVVKASSPFNQVEAQVTYNTTNVVVTFNNSQTAGAYKIKVSR